MKKTISEYYEQLFKNKLDNLHEMDHFRENTNYLNLFNIKYLI